MTTWTRRELAMKAGATALGIGLSGLLPSSAGAAAPAPSKPFDLMPYVHPELRPMVKPIMGMMSGPLDAQTLAAARRGGLFLPPLAAPAWTERTIAGPKGAPDVRIFIVNAKPGAAPRPAILHIHGGGFVVGSARSAIRGIQDIALLVDCLIVSVDYRLAPETLYSESIEDNYTALKWLYQHADELGVDRNHIAVMGESAGGGHAALLAIAARDRGEIALALQMLIYPMLDDRTGSTRHKLPYMGAIIWTPEKNRFGWSSFLGVPAGSAHVPGPAVPARVDNLAGLPPAFIAVGSIDLFADEDVEYATRLMDSGVATELHVIPGCFHGFDIVPTPTLGKTFRAMQADALRRAFAITA